MVGLISIGAGAIATSKLAAVSFPQGEAPRPAGTILGRGVGGGAVQMGGHPPDNLLQAVKRLSRVIKEQSSCRSRNNA